MRGLISRGIYDIPSAARILGTSPPAVRRWAHGYKRGGVRYDPVIENYFPEVEGVRGVGFLELVELLSVREFRKVGVPWRKIRSTFDHAAEALQTRFPFATRMWFADRAGIYYQEGDFSPLIEASGGGQVAMKSTLLQYLRQLDFGLDGLAERWYPLEPSRAVVLDPQVAYGAPVVKGTGIETAVLTKLVEGGETPDSVAWWYELEPDEVDAALEFERSLLPA